MTSTPRSASRRNKSRDLAGRLATQSGPRTSAPMWPRPFFTPGEWAVYTALWSYPNDSVFPTHQDLADRAWVERGTAADAIAKMDQLGLLEREPGERDDRSTTSNTYYLVEVPTADHLTKLEEKRRQRAEEQEAKRRKRKAVNRKYEKPQVSTEADRARGGYGKESTPARKTRGTAEKVPPGYGAGRTSGGTASAVPGSGAGRTHETLGVTEVVDLTDRLSSAPSDDQTEQKDLIPSELPDQEGYAPDGYPLELTAWESALVDELVKLREAWGPRATRIAVGHPSVRERIALNPALVRRAFLLGAADVGRPADGYRGTWTPNRLISDGCPLWAQAAAELAVESAERRSSGTPDTAGAAPAAEGNRARADRAVRAAETDVEPAGPVFSAEAARAQIAAQLAGRGYVPLTETTAAIARQRLTIPKESGGFPSRARPGIPSSDCI